MKKYYIRHSDKSYLCIGKMKESNIPNAKYKMCYYWSKYKDEYCLKQRVKRIYVIALLEKFLIKLLCNQKATIEKVM